MTGISKREFTAGVAASAALFPSPGPAQQGAPLVGFVNAASPEPFARMLAAFQQGLKEAGFIEGHNVKVEYRWAEGDYKKLPVFVSELISRRVAVIVAAGGDPAVRAAMAEPSVPIVFATGSDPVAQGYVTSFSRPGANVTGATHLTVALAAKRIGLLLELVPKAKTVGVLVNPNFPVSDLMVKDSNEAAARLGLAVVVAKASVQAQLDAAFEALSSVDILMIGSDAFFNSQRSRLAALAAQRRIPAIFEFREFASAGGLMSYGTLLSDTYRQVGIYTGRILSGEKPAQLPVVQSTRFEFVINLSAAKTLGLAVPPTLLARADEVIE